jgi:hypothetical protein
MRSLVRIQVGPPSKNPVTTGFFHACFLGPGAARRQTRRLYASVGGYAFSTAHRAFEGEVHKGREHLLERFGYDTKAVMHAVRLWRMGATALREGTLVVRRPDAAEVLQIRDCAISQADVAAFEGRELVGGFLAGEREAFEDAYRETSLPEAPDEERLSQLRASRLLWLAVNETSGTGQRLGDFQGPVDTLAPLTACMRGRERTRSRSHSRERREDLYHRLQPAARNYASLRGVAVRVPARTWSGNPSERWIW